MAKEYLSTEDWAEFSGFGMRLQMGKKKYADYCHDIYTSWRYQRMVSQGLRAGFGLCKMFPFDPIYPITDEKAISVTEHEAGVEDLTLQMLVRNMLGTSDIGCEDLLLTTLVARLHDHAERLLGGDVAQDGTRNDLKADIDEVSVFDGMLAPLYGKYEGHLSELFRQFVSQSSLLGSLVFCADKVDEVLTALFMEEKGRVAMITDKDIITKSDLQRTEFSGRFEYADVVMIHFLDMTNHIAGVRLPFLYCINYACIEASKTRLSREPWFDWWDKYLYTHQLSSTDFVPVYH